MEKTTYYLRFSQVNDKSQLEYDVNQSIVYVLNNGYKAKLKFQKYRGLSKKNKEKYDILEQQGLIKQTYPFVYPPIYKYKKNSKAIVYIGNVIDFSDIDEIISYMINLSNHNHNHNHNYYQIDNIL